MQQLYERIADVNTAYYNLRGEIVRAERRISVLTERLEMIAQYEKYKPVRKAMDGMKSKKREQYQQEKESELAAFDTANRFLRNLKETGEAITPKQWHSEKEKLTVKKDAKYTEMRAMREDIKSLESLRKAADRLSHDKQHQQKKHHR